MGAFSMRNPDFEKIRSGMKNIINMKMEKKMAMIDALEKGSKILSDDQKNKFMDMMCKWMGKGKESQE
jgi:hypothetical protein